ncbi:ADP-ribosylation factor protein 3 [Actinomortierella ambigua]|uniref:ADP-ribosylation factor protein 3 n=1 Tax=Actinomortierella ambigua TaxID=1343610 RepID=A0A9P6U134_9FUNG|nr:ADP-ribosylation factor protein 3 [Actinomortierella ambigua]
MYTFLSGLYKHMTRKEAYYIVIIGLDNAGKTTLLERIKAIFLGVPGLPPERIAPTVGLNIGRIDIGGARLNFQDLGGQADLQSIWERYYRECHAIVFVADSSDPERIQDCKRALERVIMDDNVEGIPVLMLANKQDVPTAMRLEQIKEIFNQIAERLGARDSRVLPVSALQGLVEETRNRVTKLRNQFAKESDVKRRAERAHESMLIGAVIYPSVLSHLPAEQASARLHAASMRLSRLHHDMAQLEPMPTEANEFPTMFDGMLGRFLIHYDASHALLVDLRRHMETPAFEKLGERWLGVRESDPYLSPAAPAAAAFPSLKTSERIKRVADETEDLVKRLAQEARMQRQTTNDMSKGKHGHPSSATTAPPTVDDDHDDDTAAKAFPTDHSLGTVTTIGILGPKEIAKMEREQETEQ